MILTRIRSILRLEKRTDPEELPEESTVSIDQSRPPLMVLASTGGVLSYELQSFVDVERAAEFVQSRLPQGILAFWALQEEPGPVLEGEPQETTEAVILVRDPARTGKVDLISCVDMKSAQSLVRGEAKEGLDLRLVQLYWAARVTIETGDDGSARLTPRLPPPVAGGKPSLGQAFTESPSPRAEVVQAEEKLGARALPETPPAEPAREVIPTDLGIEGAVDGVITDVPVVPEAPPPELPVEAERPDREPEVATASAAPEAPVVPEAPPHGLPVEREAPAAQPEGTMASGTIDGSVFPDAHAPEPQAEVEQPEGAVAEVTVGAGVDDLEMAPSRKVVIVDQNEANRGQIREMLVRSSFAILGHTGYGNEAIDLVKRSQPDAVVLAIEEPSAPGVKMVEVLTESLPQSSIIVYSSINDAKNIRRAMLAGAMDYLVAPISKEELARSVHTALARQKRRRERLSGEAEGPATTGKVITVFGAKGGIGKTTIAINLAASIARNTEESVVLVDLDPRFGDVSILLDIAVERSIADLAISEDEISKEMIQDCLYAHKSGVMILAAPLRPMDWRGVNTDHVERVVTLLARTYDYVILDTPGTFNDIVARALELGEINLLVTTPHVTSMKDTVMAIDMLRSRNLGLDKTRLVVNRTNDASNLSTQDIKRTLGHEVFWSIPYEPSVPVAAQLGLPLIMVGPESPAAESLADMASALSGTRTHQKPTEAKHLLGALGRISSKLRLSS